MGKIRRSKAVVKPKKIPEVPSKEVVDDGETMNEELDDGDNADGEEVLEEHNQPDFDKRSVISNKTIKSLVAKKKDKIKLKRQFLLKRLHAEHESKREAKERATRRQTVIVSDMKHEFEHSLGQIESYLEEQRLAMAVKKGTPKQIAPQAERNRQSQTNIEIFNKISQSAEYSKSPFEMIKKQLEQQLGSTKTKSK